MDYIQELIERYPALASTRTAIAQAVSVMAASFEKGGALLACGNGGSAADAAHMAGELAKGFVKKRPLPPEIQSRFDAVPEPIRSGLAHGLQQGLPAFSLSAQEALLTAIINDSGIGKELMYAQQVCVFGRKGDVFLGISTSGNAKNVQYAAITARAFGLGVIALTGETGGELAKIADVAICVPARETYKIQEYHLPVYHAICLALEERFFSC